MAVINVTSFVDGNVAGTLRHAVTTAGNNADASNTINLSAGTFDLTIGGANEDAGLLGDLDVFSGGGVGAKTLTIQGAGEGLTFIDASQMLGGLDRILHVFPNTTLEIDGVTLRGGSAIGPAGSDDGGAMLVEAGAVVTVSDSRLTGNRADDDGGAISNFGELTLERVTLDGNSAGEDGGAIENDALATVVDSTITGNTAENGGGIDNEAGADLYVYGSTIGGNAADDVGGGVRNDGYALVVDSTIEGNVATEGGGVAVRDELVVVGSTISGNTATSDGGGIYALDGAVLALGTTIEDNVAGDEGGGVYSYYGDVLLLTSTITGNQAAEGGGILNDGIGYLDVVGSTISDNTAGVGGGISNDDGSYLTVIGSTISGNTATSGDGGGIYNVDGAGTFVANSTISGNTAASGAGGGIFDAYGYATYLVNATVTGNRADTGGGVFTTGSTYDPGVYNTIIAGNVAVTANDASGDFVSNGANLLGDLTGSTGFGGDLVVPNANDVIDPVLADNGGPTLTHFLVAGSPAIDAGLDADTFGPFDQRGPGFDRIAGAAVDIGAVEAVPEPGAFPLLGLALLGVGLVRWRERRRRRRAARE